MNGSVECQPYGKAVDWHVFGSIMLHDLKDRDNKEESHDSFYWPDGRKYEGILIYWQ